MSTCRGHKPWPADDGHVYCQRCGSRLSAGDVMRALRAEAYAASLALREDG